MANLKKNVLQAISDFDKIESTIESYGIDVPYDTDTKEYGELIRSVYEKGSVSAVFNAETHYDFPSVGSVDVIYKAQTERMIYQWNPDELRYETIGSIGGGDIGNIEIINGGSASWQP